MDLISFRIDTPRTLFIYLPSTMPPNYTIVLFFLSIYSVGYCSLLLNLKSASPTQVEQQGKCFYSNKLNGMSTQLKSKLKGPFSSPIRFKSTGNSDHSTRHWFVLDKLIFNAPIQKITVGKIRSLNLLRGFLIRSNAPNIHL